jgi:TonB-dependent siderophore receptor
MKLALGLLFALVALPAAAQSAAPTPAPTPSPDTVPRREERVDVEDELPAVPPSAAAATRVPTPVESLPLTVAVVPRSVFRERGGFVLSEALKSASGVNTAPAFGVFDYFVVRGFDSLSSGLVAVDGAPEPEATFYPLYNVRQIEVLKGPSAFLYGGNPLAATVHLVRKQPASGRFAEGSFAYGRYGTYEATADGNAANADGSLSFRLGGVSQGSDGHRDGIEGSLRAIHPALTWRPSDRSRVALSFEYVRSEATPDTGIPFLNGRLADVPRTNSYQSALDASEQDLYRLRFDAERRLGERVTLRNKVYYTDLAWNSTGSLILGAFDTPVGPVVARTLGMLDDRQKVFGDQLEAAVSFQTGRAAHALLAGVEASRYTDVYSQDVGLISAMALQQPQDFTTAPVPTIPQFGQRGDSRSVVFAPYVMDRITLTDKVSLTAGARLDRLTFEDKSTATERDATRVSPLAGLVVSPGRGVSLYVSATSAFAPPSVQVIGPRDPERSRQVEAGIKSTFRGGKGYAAVAVYSLKRENIAIPDTTGLTRQEGDQESRGFELDFSAELAPAWTTYASYAFTDAELTSFAELVQLQQPPFFAVLDHSGNRPAYAPRHLATVWTSRTFRDRFTLGAGARYVSEQFVAEDNRHAIERYVTVDAVAAYRVGRSRLSVNVRNLTNTEYETRGFGGAAAVPGRPFEVLGRIEVAVGR